MEIKVFETIYGVPGQLTQDCVLTAKELLDAEKYWAVKDTANKNLLVIAEVEMDNPISGDALGLLLSISKDDVLKIVNDRRKELYKKLQKPLVK